MKAEKKKLTYSEYITYFTKWRTKNNCNINSISRHVLVQKKNTKNAGLLFMILVLSYI